MLRYMHRGAYNHYSINITKADVLVYFLILMAVLSGKHDIDTHRPAHTYVHTNSSCVLSSHQVQNVI